jgi:tetratricopeptide (TPR) repeat protein
VKLAPGLAAAHLAIGFSDYWGRGDYEAALKSFAAALTLKPNDTDALVAQGYVARRQGHYDAAIATLKQAFGLDSRNSLLASEIGITYMTAGRYPDAERWFQRALALDPHNLNAKLKLSATILFASGDIPEAWAAAQGDAPVLVFQRIGLLTLQRKYREALALLDRVPDTPDNFTAESGDSKVLEQAELYRLQGDASQARPLYAQALPRIRAQLTRRQAATTPGAVWQNLAFAELGLGHTRQGLAAAAKAQALNDHSLGRMYIAANQETSATLYAEAHRPDLAVPLLAKALVTPGIGYTYSPVMLWLDPSWDPIRDGTAFQALLQKYAKYKPTVIPTAPASATPSG